MFVITFPFIFKADAKRHLEIQQEARRRYCEEKAYEFATEISKYAQQCSESSNAEHQKLVIMYLEMAEHKRKIEQELQEKEKRKQQITAIINRYLLRHCNPGPFISFCL